jgi:hypothetical protein
LEKETQSSYLPKQEKTVSQVKEEEEIKKEEIISNEKTDETADWKTYRNEEYGFEMKYPNDWEIEIPQDPHFPPYHGINYQPESEPLLVSWSKKGIEPEKNIDFLIHTTKKPDNLFNKSFEDMYSVWLESGGRISKIMIDRNKEAIKCIRPTGPATVHLIWLKRNGIGWAFMPSGIYNLEEPERQMLSTFKFID